MVVAVRQLNKAYGQVQVLKGLDMNVEAGQVYGFLGRNGAGKSTTLRILVGILEIGSGSVELFGQSMASKDNELRQRIGYVAQEQNFYPWMTPRSIGRFVRGFYPNWSDQEYDRLVQSMELPPERPIGAFSGGMKAKQALALALAHQPPLLVLDEPTAGLDPVARREFLEIVREQTRNNGHTVLFSSHLVEEVERVAHRLGIIEGGRMAYEGSLEELRAQVRLLRLPEESEATFEGFTIYTDRIREGERQVVLRTQDPGLFESLDGLEELSLEDIFVEMVTHS
ncbi:MAG: ABC transporter ATP-binding protein [Candidatus Eremiobacteraeota bacterium]|nr:ABC transporter ATP-binding protein [Candidatus Eremiobacteraeota bacterium]